MINPQIKTLMYLVIGLSIVLCVAVLLLAALLLRSFIKRRAQHTHAEAHVYYSDTKVQATVKVDTPVVSSASTADDGGDRASVVSTDEYDEVEDISLVMTSHVQGHEGVRIKSDATAKKPEENVEYETLKHNKKML